MKKHIQILSIIMIITSVLGGICCKHKMDIIDEELNGIFHNLERDEKLKRDYNRLDLCNKLCRALCIFGGLGFFLTIIPSNRKVIAPSIQPESPKGMKDLEGIDQPERNHLQLHEFQPTLNRTSHNKSLVLCDDFDSEFMPHFAQTRNTEYGDTHLTIFKEALTKNTWTQTELARIALLLFDSGVLQAVNNELIPWIRKFFKMVGRQDIPKKPSRRDLAFSESENCKKILETFKDLVDYANTTTKGANILDKISRKNESLAN